MDNFDADRIRLCASVCAIGGAPVHFFRSRHPWISEIGHASPFGSA